MSVVNGPALAGGFRVGVVVAVVLVSVAASERVRACAPPPYYYSPDVVVARVQSVSDGPATQGDPPRVVLEVEQVLRGELKTGKVDGVWNPQPHDIDTGGREAEKAAWNAKPMEKPGIGKKFILFGGMRDNGPTVFQVCGSGKFAFSEKELAETKKLLAWCNAEREAGVARKEADKKELAAKLALWKYQTSAESVAKWARMADFVAVARVSGGHCGYEGEASLDFSVERVLKGTKRAGVFVGDAYFVSMKVPPRVNQMLDREAKYVLFLLDRGDDMRKKPVYEPIGEGDGIVIAEEEMVEAVRSGMKE